MSPDRKLLLLGVGFLAACGIGAQSWLAMSDDRSESGFDGADPFPLVSTTTLAPPIEFDVPMSSRNPFEFVAAGSAAPTTDGADEAPDDTTDDDAPSTTGGTSSSSGTQITTVPTREPSTTTTTVTETGTGSFDDLRRDDSPADPDDERGR